MFVKALRSAHARIRGQASQFGSQRLGYLLRSKERDDPAIPVHVLPLNAWARTVWDDSVPISDLEVAMQWAEDRRLHSKSPWHRVLGPAGAVVTSLARLGWEVHGATKWVDDQGSSINLLECCPKSLTVLVERSVHRWTWRTWATDHPEFAHLSDGADLGPIVSLINRSPTDCWGPAEQGCLEAVLVGGAPSQQKLEAADMAIDDRCQWCHAEVGSYMHRHWRCDGTRAFRSQYGMPQAVSDAAANCNDQVDEVALFARALYPDLRCRAPKPSDELHIKWNVRPPDGVFQGRCCIDGAGLQPQDAVLCRAGWAICQIDGLGDVEGEVCGNLPGLMQHPGLGELHAFLML